MNDTILIEESHRAGARLVIGLAGPSGEGKTYTALLLAYGLAGCVGKKVGLLDTENKRGALYSDILPNGDRFRRGDLYAPFSPQRYIDGIKAFQQAGVEVLVIDSCSHSWEGPGGCEEIAESGGRMPNWKEAKKQHKRFVNALLLCDMHVICCLRAREKTSFKNPSKPESLGMQPICEKNFMFEMTASLMMREQGKAQDILKCPKELLPILGRQKGYIGIEDGKALRDWVNGAGGDPLESLRNRLRLAASEGSDELRKEWETISAGDRKALGAQFLATLKTQAAAVDAEEAQKHSSAVEPGHVGDAHEALRNLVKPGNSYGVTEAQLLKHCCVTTVDEIKPGIARDLVDKWVSVVEELAKEEV